MFLLIDFEGFTNRTIINKKLNIDTFSYPCVLSYVVIDDLSKLEYGCERIQTKWFPITKNINKIVAGFFKNIINKGKIKYIIFHGNYEYSILSPMNLKPQLIDLNSILSTKLSSGKSNCLFKSEIEDGKTAHFMLTKYFKTGKISMSLKKELENYNKKDVAKLTTRFKKLIYKNLETKKHEDILNLIKLQKKLKIKVKQRIKNE